MYVWICGFVELLSDGGMALLSCRVVELRVV